MAPEITDALIAHAIETKRMIAAGREYWRQGRVRQLKIAPDGSHVEALVRGSDVAPYTVDLHFDAGPKSRVSALCTCPVGLGCKHAAATL